MINKNGLAIKWNPPQYVYNEKFALKVNDIKKAEKFSALILVLSLISCFLSLISNFPLHKASHLFRMVSCSGVASLSSSSLNFPEGLAFNVSFNL